MIINHNLPGSNAIKSMNTNSANASKSMQKLSSGLRINSAADDAAGLAISEKMRGQIRGLDQASANSQDSISMIQTGEGALSETTSILQRMRELAVQGSNDTNTSTDRTEIQKEMNQLTSEINRIGNTTEFNTRKILNGDISTSAAAKQVDGVPAGDTTDLTGLTIDGDASLVAGNYKVNVTNDGGIANKYQNVASASDLTTSGTALTVTSMSATNHSDVNLAEGNYKVVIASQIAKSASTALVTGTDVLDTAGTNPAVTVDANSNLAVGAKQITVIKSVVKDATDVTGGGISNVDANTAKEGAYEIKTSAVAAGDGSAVVGAIDNATTGAMSNITIATNSTLDDAANDYTIKITQIAGAATDGQVSYKFELQSGGTTMKAADGSTDIAATTTVTSAAGSTKITLGDISFDLDNAKMWASDSNDDATEDSAWHNDAVALTIQNKVDVKQISTGQTQSLTFNDGAAPAAGQTFTFTGAEAGVLKLDVTDAANAFVRGNTFTTNVTDTDTYHVKLVGQAAADTVLTENQLTAANLTNISLGDAGNGLNIDLDAAKLNGMAVGTSTIDFTVASGTSLTATLKNIDGTAVGGSGTIALTGTGAGSTADLGNGMKLTYDGTTPNTTVKAGDVVVSVKDVIPADDFKATLLKSTDGGGTYTESVATQSFNKGDTVDFSAQGVSVKTEATVAAADNVTFDVKNGAADKSLTMQVGANKGQNFSIDINDMRAKAIKISGGAASDNAGVTGASYVGTANVSNGTDNNNSEFALDLGDAKKATAAIEVIDKAIQTVSGERSKLGAYQNRLEHTIANLGTSSENLTSAESRIRDVDMAKEMSTFSKNNILSQAAQAMLAQANQQPQQVLQLLR